MRASLCRRLGAFALLAAMGCGAAPESEEELELGEAESAVVGGRMESGYGPAGYLLKGAVGAAPTGRSCTGVQVGPNLVLTAAHCFMNWDADPVTSVVSNHSWGFGHGQVVDAVRDTASRVIIHPNYNPNGDDRFENDLALVLFDRPLQGGRWADIDDPQIDPSCGDASQGTDYTYVGYGRDTVGGHGVPGNQDRPRKSATQCISDVDALSIYASGVSGGLCWGDSGGPLFETGGTDVVGVLSDFDAVFDCQVGNDMIFTQLTSFHDFICDSTIYVGEGKFCDRAFTAEVITALGT